MNFISKDRYQSIKESAQKCESFFIASALITSSGLNLLIEEIASKPGKIVIGCDLNSDPQALQKILETFGERGRFYPPQNNGGIFHPKVYGFKMSDNQYTIYIGSGNWTNGGFVDNNEVFLAVSEKEVCAEIVRWFDDIYSESKPLNTEICEAFEHDDTSTDQSHKTRIDLIMELLRKQPRPSLESYFFQECHYNTFTAEKIGNDNYDGDREEVVNKLKELDGYLWPRINTNQWNIHHSKEKNNLTSTSNLAQAKAINLNTIGSIWLHYGKSPEEIKSFKEVFGQKIGNENDITTFIHYMRLQVTINEKHLGVWLVFGKPNASWDRENMRDKAKDPEFVAKLQGLLSDLSAEYDVDVNGKDIRKLNTLTLEEILKEERSDRDCKRYFRIGIDFEPIDPRVRKENIVDTVIGEFAKLYPIYDLCKRRL